MPPALGARSLNHYATREVPTVTWFLFLFLKFYSFIFLTMLRDLQDLRDRTRALVWERGVRTTGSPWNSQ